MNQFAFSGELVPGMGNSGGLKAFNRYTGKEVSFDGGDPGLQYRFWNPAENGFKGNGSSADRADSGRADSEVLAEEAAFLGLENLFACRRECKQDLGGASNLRDCIRSCKGKGLRKSALKTKEAESQGKMADALGKIAAEPTPTAKSNTMAWVVGIVVALIIIGLLIYFLTRKKAEIITEVS